MITDYQILSILAIALTSGILAIRLGLALYE